MANTDYKGSGGGAFAPIALLAAPVDYLTEEFALKGYNLPTAASLFNGMGALINGEFVLVTVIGVGKISVKRGCADTVPAQHAANSLVWFIDNTVGTDRKEHAGGEDIAVKVTPWTIGGGKLPVAAAPPNDLHMNWRFFRPYAPGQMKSKDLSWFIPGELSANDPLLALSWADRDRKLQADRLIDHTQGNIGPEPGTTYTARVYNSLGELKRTEVGIIGHNVGLVRVNEWSYQWSQALNDLGFVADPEIGEILTGSIRFASTRDGFDSWQDYAIPFTLDTQGYFLRSAQFAAMVAQPTSDDPDAPPNTGMYSAEFAAMTAQAPGSETQDHDAVAADGMYVAGFRAGAGQLTSFYTPINRNLFEAPYTWLARRGVDPMTNRLVTVAARPSDRLTDSHSVLSRFNFPKGTGSSLPFLPVDTPSFTPWLTINFTLQHLEKTATIRTSSFYDGVPLLDVVVGSLALIGAEVVRVESVTEFAVTLGRGCCDTVPQTHQAGSRLWFFEAMSGNDPTTYPWITMPEKGAAVEVKIVPTVYGPPLALDEVPTDSLDMNQRTERPFAPGRVVVNGRPWFEGAQTVSGEPVRISWAHRNRITQGGIAIDHSAPSVAPEDGQTYRLRMTVIVPAKRAGERPTKLIVRDIEVAGESFDYPYEYALADGNKVGRILGICGTVSIDLFLQSVRDDFDSWQGYSILLRLPSYACAPGQTPGGGQIGIGDPGNGNGQPGGAPPPGNDNSGGVDPINNAGDGDDGAGPPKPPDPPPEWPDPVDPPPAPPTTDPNPELAAHWDTNWDRHWDAYRQDDTGGE